MKGITICKHRKDNRCLKNNNVCIPGETTELEHPVCCWRMHEDRYSYLQCPDCLRSLWYDEYMNPNGLRSIFYCPDCDKNVDRSQAIQTIERLEKVYTENENQTMELEFMKNSPKASTLLTALKHEMIRIGGYLKVLKK